MHRDLKPGNVMLTRSGAKLMDFGLARASGLGATSELTSSPTVTGPLTAEGTILGTFPYMAPEQLEGQEADARADLWALGCVLYEMAAGKRAFEGKSQASLITAIMGSEPVPISQLSPLAPPALDRLVGGCLAKDPAERIQSAHDVKLQLQWIVAGGPQTGVPAPVAARRKSREALAWSLLIAIAIAAAALVLWTRLHPPLASAGPVLAFVPPPPDTHFLAFGFGSGPAVVSPDETKLAFSAIDRNGSIKLWTRSLKASDATAVPGTEGAAAPFWSPDSRSLGFFAGGKLKTVELGGGNLQVLADSSSPHQAAWAPDGTILFKPASSSPLFRVSATGGKASSFTVVGADDYTDGSPALLPDGKHVLVSVVDKKRRSRIELRSLTSPETTRVLDDAKSPAYAGGYLFFIKDTKVFAQPFDPASGKVSGAATPLADADSYSLRGRSILTFQSVSRDTRLQWFDLSGNLLGTIGQVAYHISPRISPDGKQILFMAASPQNPNSRDLWLLPATGGVSSRLTFTPGFRGFSVWSPDGKYVAYAKTTDGKISIVRKPSDGSGAEEPLLALGPEISSAGVVDWSPDGRHVSYDAFDVNKGRWTIWCLPLFGDKKPFEPAPLAAGGQYDGLFSPDGHWLAYFSDETDQPEVYVVPFPGPGGKYQISNGGGWQVHWDKQGDLLFLSTGKQLMKAEMTLSAQALQLKSLRPLFQVNVLDVNDPLFDVTADGQRILAVTPARAESSSIGLLLNWPALLDK
jgi:Tol biopolymer transport system component